MKLFDYNIYPETSEEKFAEACRIVRQNICGLTNETLLEDVDGTQIQIYECGKKRIKIWNDYEVGAVYIESDINLDDCLVQSGLCSCKR